MDVASEWGEGLVMAGVETCVCPPGYAGTSCEVSYASGTSDCLLSRQNVVSINDNVACIL